jgi:hypothetical protein
MRRISTLIAVAGFAAACTVPTAEQPPEASALDEGVQPVATVVAPKLGVQPEAHDVDSRSDGPADPWGVRSEDGRPAATIEKVATQTVIELLEDEGLLVLDIDSTAEPPEGSSSTVRTTVLYGTGRSHPQQDSYLLKMESTAGTWTVLSVEPTP